MIYLLIFFISLIITLFITPYLIKLYAKVGIVDKPDKRRNNKIPIPRMGGLVIALVVIISLFFSAIDLNSVRLLFISFFLILLCGLIDDLVGLRWGYKLVLQIGSILYLISYLNGSVVGIEIFTVKIDSPLSYLILFFFALGTVNSVNLLDGMDGLVSGFSLLVLSYIFILFSLTPDHIAMILTVAALGGVFGFIKFNANPARIYLGDTGSLFLGFLLVLLLLRLSITSNANNLVDLTFPIIVMGVPIIDTLKVFFIRIYKRQNPFHPDRSHIHHIIYGRNINHKTTVFLVLLLSFLFLIDSVVYISFSKYLAMILFVILGFLLLSIKIFLNTDAKIGAMVSLYFLKYQHYAVLFRSFLKYLFYFSAVGVLLVIAEIHFHHTILNNEFYSITIGAYLILAMVALYNFRKTKTINHLYVYFNLLGFAVIGGINSMGNVISLGEFSSSIRILDVIHIISIGLIIGFILLHTFLREIDLTDRLPFIDGLDLILIIFTVFIFTTSILLNESSLGNLRTNIPFVLLLYIWFKTAVHLNPRMEMLLYYLSFLLIPLLSIHYF